MSKAIDNTFAKVKKIKWIEHLDTAAIISLLITVVYFCVLYKTGHMTVTYDSAVDRSIANGDMIGYPNAHLIFTNYVFGLILAALYNLLPMWNWYTIMLLTAMYFALWAALYRVVSLTGNGHILRQLISGTLAVFLFNIFFFDSLMSIYFLNCALIAGICAFFYIISIEELRRRDVIIIAILMIMCSGIRFSVFEELLPFLLIAGLIRYFIFRRRKYIFALCGSIVLIIGLMHIINANAYTGIYANEKEVNHYRAAIQDYNGLPSYEGHEELYQSLGMDEEECSIMRDCWGLSDHLDKDTLMAILAVNEAEHSDSEYKKKQVFSLIKNMIKVDYTKKFWLMETFSILAAILFMLQKKDWGMLLCYLSIFAVFACEIYYLAYIGRMPVRVTLSPLLALMFTGVGYIIQYRDEWIDLVKSSKITRRILMTGIIMYLCCGCMETKDKYNNFQNSYSKTAVELSMVKYILNDSVNEYFIHGLHDELDLYNPIRRNYTGWGGWISETIDWKVMLQGEYDNIWDAIAYREDLRLVVSDSTIETLQNYLTNHGYNCEPKCEVVDVEGNTYNVWRFEAAE